MVDIQLFHLNNSVADGAVYKYTKAFGGTAEGEINSYSSYEKC